MNEKTIRYCSHCGTAIEPEDSGELCLYCALTEIDHQVGWPLPPLPDAEAQDEGNHSEENGNAHERNNR